MSEKSEDSVTSSSGKVGRLIEKYGLTGIGDDLENFWTAEEERLSLRELTAYFNKELLRTRLESEDVDILPGEVDNLHHLLTDDEVTSGVQTQAENRLRNQGLDPNQLTSDFVSRQAIHTYLKNDRGAKYGDGDSTAVDVDSQLEHIQRLKSRQSAVAEQTLSSLRNKDKIALGEFHVLVTVRVQCIECNTQYVVGELFDRGGCNCSAKH